MKNIFLIGVSFYTIITNGHIIIISYHPGNQWGVDHHSTLTAAFTARLQCPLLFRETQKAPLCWDIRHRRTRIHGLWVVVPRRPGYTALLLFARIPTGRIQWEQRTTYQTCVIVWRGITSYKKDTIASWSLNIFRGFIPQLPLTTSTRGNEAVRLVLCIKSARANSFSKTQYTTEKCRIKLYYALLSFRPGIL